MECVQGNMTLNWARSWTLYSHFAILCCTEPRSGVPCVFSYLCLSDSFFVSKHVFCLSGHADRMPVFISILTWSLAAAGHQTSTVLGTWSQPLGLHLPCLICKAAVVITRMGSHCVCLLFEELYVYFGFQPSPSSEHYSTNEFQNFDGFNSLIV